MSEQEVFFLEHPVEPRNAVVVMLPDGRLRVDEHDRDRGGQPFRVEIEATPAGGEFDLLTALVGLAYIEQADVLAVRAAWMAGTLDDLTTSLQRIVALISALHRVADQLRVFRG